VYIEHSITKTSLSLYFNILEKYQTQLM